MYEDNDYARRTRLWVRTILGGFVAIFILTLIFSAFTTVQAGEVGVIKRFGRVTGRVLDPGFHLVMPFADDVLKYDTKKVIYETRRNPDADTDKGIYLDHTVDTNTSDGQQVDVFFTIRFSVDPTKATDVANTIGSQDALVDKVVRPEARIWARNVPRNFEAAQLYSGEVTEVQNRIEEALRGVYSDNGIILDEVGIREIEFSDEYVQAIEDKQIEAVKVETEQNRAEQAKFEKERRITQAEAAAEEQRLQQATLGEEVLEKIQLDVQLKMIEKWNGEYPKTLITNGADQFILPLPEQ